LGEKFSAIIEPKINLPGLFVEGPVILNFPVFLVPKPLAIDLNLFSRL
jgi:hypothetical protein